MTAEPELIQKSKEGDPKAFGRLIHRYEDRIYNLTRQVCASAPAEADDIYQETFLTAFRKIGQFRERSALGTWLYRIASNLCLMRLRKRRREPFVPILDLPEPGGHTHGSGVLADTLKDHGDDPEKTARQKELRRAVTEALEALPVDYRLAVVLKDIQGLSNEESAKILGLSVAAVKSRLHRGRLFLRDRLAGLSPKDF